MNLTWLQASYPFEKTNGEKRDTILTLSILGSLVLILLQPFGYLAADQILHFIAVFIIGVLAATVNYFGLPYFFPDIFDEKRWSVLKAFIFLSYNFLIIGLWNHIYTVLFIKQNIFLISSAPELTESLLKTMIIGLTAAAFLILFRYNLFAKRHLQISQELNLSRSVNSKPEHILNEEAIIELLLEGSVINVKRSELTYISAEGNYIALHFRNRGKNVSPLYRATMKQVEEQVHDFPEFFRCHRSFIINLNMIESSLGNSQGLFIKVDDANEEIPVARPNIKRLRQLLVQSPRTKKQLVT